MRRSGAAPPLFFRYLLRFGSREKIGAFCGSNAPAQFQLGLLLPTGFQRDRLSLRLSFQDNEITNLDYRLLEME
jgi:hypothetical protein